MQRNFGLRIWDFGLGIDERVRRKVQGTRRYGSLGFAVIGSLRYAVIGHSNETADDRQQTTAGSDVIRY